MQLSKILTQGQLIYFSREQAAISVYENSTYRWLTIDNVVQSLLLKRRPEKLTLRHQYKLALPALMFNPKTVVELGLGGGNFNRFIANRPAQTKLTSVDSSSLIIEIAKRFFYIKAQACQQVNLTAEQYMQQCENQSIDWLIDDIYQPQATQLPEQKLINYKLKLMPDGILSLNLPSPTQKELAWYLIHLAKIFERPIWYAKVPGFQNVIIHCVEQASQVSKRASLLPRPWRFAAQGFQLFSSNRPVKSLK
jgi:spermidine synthase